ncbi:hypothetical protein [Deinococcus sp. Marseille-Q6407]|uniref:hypothetical protein n=1 Tax=Deinococcus sp. Marseille-Q6407 TaxID=2969223 RepID=UPI0021C0DE03|nr:hypothetical protein [Deinococcus sp. Marseille-Q6407]
MTTLPQTTFSYRGFEITLDAAAQARRMACPWYVRELRRWCRAAQDARLRVDEYLAAEADRQPGALRMTALDTTPRLGLSAGQCRNRAEQARAQDRQGGRFVAGGAK